MTRFSLRLTAGLCGGLFAAGAASPPQNPDARLTPLGPPGRTAIYRYAGERPPPESTVEAFSVTLGRVEAGRGKPCQWWRLEARKANGERFRVWLLTAGFPPADLKAARRVVVRYLIQEGDAEPVEFRRADTGEAVLPLLGGWRSLIPRAAASPEGTNPFPEEAAYLGLRYRRLALRQAALPIRPPRARVLRLTPDLLVGPAHNTRQRDETRRYDDSDYELVRLKRADYEEMIAAGMTCLRVDAEQLPWVIGRDVFYWGPGAKDLPYPELLYRSNYLGPTLFFDEPAVCARDFVLRPRLAREEAFRRDITPQIAFREFQKYFDRARREGPPRQLLKQLAARPDVDVGDMDLVQADLYTWDTMPATAAYQLMGDPRAPAAAVFEPPGRFGVRRTLPEINMTYGCQIPADDPKCLIDIIYGFLRGAARQTGKGWGMSIYGAVDRGDAFWFLTHAYDLGARLFFFWDTHRLACAPYSECLALARNLRNHAANFPKRDMDLLLNAAEAVILLPPGYNLGHVHLGKGNLWGLGELNLERRNRKGVKYRLVMRNFFTEIERFLRLGVAFDLLWDLPNVRLEGYREIVRIREDGRVEVVHNGRTRLLERARTPPRPGGDPPRLTVRVEPAAGPAPLQCEAVARVRPGSAPVYYTLGADDKGVYHNAVAAWELYGPGEPDCRFLIPPRRRPRVRRIGKTWEARIAIRLSRPGAYRLRVAATDLAGRVAVVWKTLRVAPHKAAQPPAAAGAEAASR